MPGLPLHAPRPAPRPRLRDAGAADRFELAVWTDLVAAAPPAAARATGAAVLSCGPATVSIAAGIPSPEFNRAVLPAGAGLPSEAETDAMLATLRRGHAAAARVQIPDLPAARTLAARLARRGLTEAPRRWVVLTRDTAAAVPPAPTGLALRRIGPAEAPAAGRTFRLAYGLPPAFDDWIAALAGRPGWQGYAAFDGPAIVATALLFLGGDRAILTGAATLPAARGRGAQRALIALRLADARAAGAGIVQSHTGLPVADERNPSLDNMRAMGFRPSHVRRNFALPPDAGA